MQTRMRRTRACALLIATLAIAVSPGAAQTAKPAAPTPTPWTQDLSKNPELLAAYGRLYDKLQSEVHLPAGRSQSLILPLLPAGTVFYAASANYGEAAQQALDIFHGELRQSAALQQWWTHGDMATTGPKLEDALQKYIRISQYLGDEIVVSGDMDRSHPSPLLIAPIKKPGLKLALQQVLQEISATTKPGVRILDPQDLAALPDQPQQDLLVLVRPDYLAASSNPAVLRSFNARLDSGSREFASTPFAHRIARAYEDGVTVVAAADLHTLVTQVPAKNAQDAALLQRTGFGDVQYMVWEHTKAGGQDISQSELSFNGPRHGIAAWLGTPRALGSLDFVSPKALAALSFVLANPAQVYDDVRQLATAANPNGFGAVTQGERALNISYQQDLLRPLGGEMTFVLDRVAPPAPAWSAILRVNDPAHLQQTLNTILAAENTHAEEVNEAGVTYRTVRVPAGKSVSEVTYAFVDGYLVVGSTGDSAREAVRLHRSGESLAKSPKFLASLPPGHASGLSGLVYEDPIAIAALQMQQVAPELVGTMAQLSGKTPPLVMTAYGEESAIRGASTSAAMDAGVVMMIAAIAIPNLLRSRIVANEAAAVGALRTINTAEVTYQATYPERGLAPNLATLGPNPGGPSADHAGLVDAALGCSNPDGWCEKSGYRFRITPVCYLGQCPQYVAVAVPVNAGAGSRNFCSALDGVIHFQAGPPLAKPPSIAECKAWPPLQ